MSLLDSIDRPQDLHALSDDDLARVAQEIREHIIDTVGEIGGHFGANLGVCELSVALHSLMDSPRDKILWDVGHQAYPHKILTGRRDRLETIRKYGGLAPFCAIAESEHDIMGAGHASTSIGYAVGLKEGMKRRGRPGGGGKVVAVIGDGSMTGGVAFEAIHQAGGLGTPIVVVLNDNGMSISPNVGAMSRYFNRVRLNPKLWHTRESVEERLMDLPGKLGPVFERLGPQFKESIKAFWAPGLFWEELDWAYVGVIDGHDVRAASPSRPAKAGAIVPPPPYTKVFGDALVAECRRDERVVGITAAMNTGTGLDILQKAMPERYFDIGIAEQQAILFAAGLSLEGCKPVAAIYSTFLQRAYDQIVHDVCLQRLNVVFALDRAGLVGDDGPTHHGMFDIAYLRPLPNLVLMAPRDEAMLVHMLRTGLLHDGPIALRYPRGEAVGVLLPAVPVPIEIGTGEILREGDGKVAIIGYGSGVGRGLDAADLLLEHGIEATVADARFAKPIDVALMARLAADHELLVTVEEGVLAGGFGSAVWEALSEADLLDTRIMRVGLPDRYVTHGAPAALYEEVGFTGRHIAERILAAVAERAVAGA